MTCKAATAPYGGKPLVPQALIVSYILFAGLVAFLTFAYVYFLRNQHSSVYLRSRNSNFVLLSIVGVFLFCGVNVLIRDIAGSTTMPCWLFYLFIMFSGPLIAGPAFVALLLYVNRIAFSRMHLKNNTLKIIKGNASVKSVAAYCKYLLVGVRNPNELENSLQFAASKYFVVCLFTFCGIIPCLMFYVILIAVDPVARECNGCYIITSITVFFCLLAPFATFTGTFIVWNERHYDRLGVVNEFFLVFWIGSAVNFFGVVLQQVDPGGLQNSYRYLNWNWLNVIGCCLIVYFQSIHQVFLSKKCLKLLVVRNKNLNVYLSSNHIAPGEIIKDIMENVAVFKLLRAFMAEELCDDALDLVVLAKKWTGLENQVIINEVGLCMYYTFIHPGCPRNVRLSRDVHHKMMSEMERILTTTNRIIPATYFEPALKELQNMLLFDTLPRFVVSPAYVKEFEDSPSILQVWLGKFSGFSIGRQQQPPQSRMQRLENENNVPSALDLTSQLRFLIPWPGLNQSNPSVEIFRQHSSQFVVNSSSQEVVNNNNQQENGRVAATVSASLLNLQINVT